MKVNINDLDKFEDNKFERIKRKKPNFNSKIDKKRNKNFKPKQNGIIGDSN